VKIVLDGLLRCLGFSCRRMGFRSPPSLFSLLKLQRKALRGERRLSVSK